MADVAVLGLDIDSSDARGAAKDLLRFNQAALDATKGVDKLERSQSKLYRNEKGQFISSADAAERYGNEVERLANKYNATLSSQIAFQREQEELNRAVQLGVLTQEQYQTALASSAARMQTAAAQSNTLTNAQRGTAGAAGNVFAQFNDIGVMMASGQSPFVLALQQGTQLNQVWAQMGNNARSIGGAITGAFRSMLNPVSLLTIGVIAGGAAFFQWATGAREAAVTIDDVNSSINDLKSSIDEIRAVPSLLTADGVAEITHQYGQLNAQVVSHVTQMRLLNTEALRFKNIELFSDLRATFAGGLLSTELTNMQSQLGLNVGQANQLSAAFDRLDDSRSIQDQISALDRMLQVLNLATGGTENMDNAQFKMYQTVLQARDALLRQAEATRLANAAMASGEVAAVSYAGVLGIVADAAQRAAQAQANLNAQVSSGNQLDPLGAFSGGGAFGDSVQVGFGGTLRTPTINDPEDDDTGTGGGGGGGASAINDDFQRRYEALQNGFRSEFDLTVTEYQRQQETLEQALSRKLLTEQEYQRNKQLLYTMTFEGEFERQQLQYQMELQALTSARENELLAEADFIRRRNELYSGMVTNLGQTTDNLYALQLGQLAGHLGEMNQLAGGGYDKLLQAQKVFASASALISTYQGAAKALELPFPYNIAAAAKVIAAGMGFVSAIKGGGGSSAQASSSTSAQQAAQTQAPPQREVLVRLEGDDWIVDMADNIMTQIYDQSKDGRVVVARDR